MLFSKLRSELKEFYWYKLDDMADAFYEKCKPMLDEKYSASMTSYQAKAMQYHTIADMFEPILFRNLPFYYEMGTMVSKCDGAGSYRGHLHPGGWVARKNGHLFIDQNPEAWERFDPLREEHLINLGPYCDAIHHFTFNYRPVFVCGLKGIYEKALQLSETAQTSEERDFLNGVCQGLLAVKKIAEKFAVAAEDKLKMAEREEERQNLTLIRDTAMKTPWNKPETLYEALNCYAFFRKIVGALEGVGPNTFGRVDMDLYPFYDADIKSGRITKEEAYELIVKFLLIWDCHYDHDMKMEGYADWQKRFYYINFKKQGNFMNKCLIKYRIFVSK